MNAIRADGSGKTTRLLDFKRDAVPSGYSVIYLPLALPMNDDLKTFWHSVYKVVEPPAKDSKPFSDGSDFVAYVEGIKGKLLALIDDIDKLATASPLVYREFFRVLSVLHQSRSEFYAIAMGTWGIANLAITSSIEPSNMVIDSQVPYFSRSQVEDLFYGFQKNDHFLLDPNVRSAFADNSSEKDSNSYVVTRPHTYRLPLGNAVPFRNGMVAAQRTKGRFSRSRNPMPRCGNFSPLLLPWRSGPRSCSCSWEDAIADSLTAEGVLIQSDRFRVEYRMTSAFVDGFLCTKLLSAKYPIRSRDAPPVVDKKLVVLDAVKEATRHFERGLLQDDSLRSHKVADLSVDWRTRAQAPRQGLYTADSARILSTWMTTSEGWSVTTDWYSSTIGMHSYITIKKGTPAAEHTVIIAVLATGDADSVHLRVLGLTEYKELLGADGAWPVHFTREDDYEPVWQTSDPLEKGVNVVHFQHDPIFSRGMMSAQWKGLQGQTRQIIKEVFKMFVLPPRTDKELYEFLVSEFCEFR
ncbi:hypothetical protein ARMGADRAFT_1102651 [Armillaria gallica]|uniref:Uncharacterized protein n=1 Tax=Armillaria gallica TaxID=47427 RepID=A0A2H3DV92_ARMGA|nr:hypothetical protein ARMGADRAFT_1102651 [Armillaria gallica]